MKTALLAAVCLASVATLTNAAQLKEARVTQVINDVRILPGQAAARPASVNETIREGHAVRTGTESRAELTFTDSTLARMGANTIFSFNEGTRNIDLSGGAVLLRVPKDAGGAKINTAAITAAITGTTILLEYHPDAYIKLIVIEGTARMYIRGRTGESVLVHAGQMLIVNPKSLTLPDPVDVDLNRLIKTSLLINMGPVGSENLMMGEMNLQLEKKADGRLVDTNLVIYGRGTAVSLVDPTQLDQISQADIVGRGQVAGRSPSPQPSVSATATPSASPSASASASASASPSASASASPSTSPTTTPVATPSKFGTPPTIASPVPYIIANSTNIQTDPSIATNGGAADFGKIYRDNTQDGPLSAYLFTATSSFDTTSGFDNQFSGANSPNVPLAAFKFADLQLAGNPVISVANGGATNLALVSELGITSAPAGDTTFTFNGLQTVVLAAQNGSITLSGISFKNINTLIFYARGAGSNLTLGSPITGSTQLRLLAEGDIQVNAPENAIAFRAITGNDYNSGSGPITAPDVLISATRDINFASQQFPVSASGNRLVLGANRNANLDVSGDQSVFTNASHVNVDGVTISVTSNGATPAAPATLQLNANPVNFNAGTGGLQASSITFAAPVPAGAQSGKLEFNSMGDINVNAISVGDNVNAAGLINAGGLLDAVAIGAGTSITTGGDLNGRTSIQAGTTINGGGLLSSPSVQAGGNVTADHVTVENLAAPNGVLTAGSGGITPFLTASGPALQHAFTVSSIVSANGMDFSGNNFSYLSGPQSGGLLDITATTLSFDKNGGIAFANFNGSDNSSSTANGGSGGKLTATTTGDITVNAPVTATTGTSESNNTFAGNGGTVDLHSSAGAVNVNSLIQVSSNDPIPGAGQPPQSLHRSNTGGHITLTSDLTTGTGINITSNSALLSQLNDNAPGPAGDIQLTTGGADILVGGALEATFGNIAITQTATPAQAPGQIALDKGSLTSETLLVDSKGNLNIALSNPFSISAPTTTLMAALDINGSTLSLVGQPKTSSGDVSITAGGNINFTDALSIAQTTSAASTTGLNIVVDAGQQLSVGSLRETVTLNGNNHTSGGNLTLNVGTNATATQAGNGFTLDVENPNAAGIQHGTVGNATMVIGGGVSTTAEGGINLTVNNNGGGDINTGGNIFASIGGSVNVGTVFINIDNRGSHIGTGANITLGVSGDVNASNAFFYLLNTPNGKIDTGGNISVTANNMALTGSLDAYIDNTDGSIASGGTVTLQVNGKLSVTNDLNVFGTTTVTGTISAGTLSSTDVTATGGIQVGSGGIQRFHVDTLLGPDAPLPFQMHTLTAPAISSTGGINFNGRDDNQPFGPSAGGNLTINTTSLSIGSAGGIQGTVTFNGGGSTTNEIGADGGTFTVNTSGAINVDSDVEADTGLQPTASATPSGNGGSVRLNSSGDQVSVTARIQVSSDGSSPAGAPPPAQVRRSNRGGNIALGSGATSGVAINISNTGQLLSLLNSATPNAGGKITIIASNAGPNTSAININGKLQAQGAGSSIDIRHEGESGTITFNNATLGADVVKAAAMGTNGTLTIGGGVMSANSLLYLYAQGSNGQLDFVANCELSSGSKMNLAANTITIEPRVTVTINGLGGPANVYTNHPNYSFTPGAGYTGPPPNNANGVFDGNKANDPQPLGNAPPFPGP